MSLKRYLSLFLLAVALPATHAAAEEHFALRASTLNAAAGTSVTLEILHEADTSRATALAFFVEYDATKLRFDESSTAAFALKNVHVEAPAGFATATFVTAEGTTSRIGISIYDPAEPLAPIPIGTLARINFETLPGANGFAFVRVSSEHPPTAADARGELVSYSGAPTGGVAIHTPRAQLSAQPSHLEFGTVEIGSRTARNVILSNSGNADLQLKSVALEGDAVFSSAPLAATTLRPGASIGVEVAITPTRDGRYSGRLVVETDTAQRHIIPVSGSALPPGAFAFDSQWLLPAVARLESPDQSRWQSNLWISNVGEKEAAVRLTLFSGTREYETETIPLPSRHSVALDDVVSRLSSEAALSGYVVIEGSSPDLVFRSTTVNVRDSGLSGQGVPVILWNQLYHHGEVAHLIGLDRIQTRRSNIALVNPSTDFARLQVDLTSSDGTLIASRNYDVPPRSVIQSIDLFTASEVGERELMSARISCTAAPCTFFAYASTIESSGSAVFQSPR